MGERMVVVEGLVVGLWLLCCGREIDSRVTIHCGEDGV